jgi:hypothetical protein
MQDILQIELVCGRLHCILPLIPLLREGYGSKASACTWTLKYLEAGSIGPNRQFPGPDIKDNIKVILVFNANLHGSLIWQEEHNYNQTHASQSYQSPSNTLGATKQTHTVIICIVPTWPSPHGPRTCIVVEPGSNTMTTKHALMFHRSFH